MWFVKQVNNCFKMSYLLICSNQILKVKWYVVYNFFEFLLGDIFDYVYVL